MSPKSSSSKNSAISLENVKVKNAQDEEKIKSVFDLIDKLPKDMQEVVFKKLSSYKPSNSNKLSLVSKEFRNIYSYRHRLSNIHSATPKLMSTNVRKQTDKVISTIGDLKLKTINEYTPIKDELSNIFTVDNIEDEAKELFMGFNTIEQAKQKYIKDFDDKKRDFVESWNFDNSKLDSKIGKTTIDTLKFIQDKIKLHKSEILKFDKENADRDLQNIDSFLKLTKNNTYAEYIEKLRNLPFGAKVIVGL